MPAGVHATGCGKGLWEETDLLQLPAMRNRRETIYRMGLGLLFLVFLGWAGWVHAQATNPAARAMAEEVSAARDTNGPVLSPVIP